MARDVHPFEAWSGEQFFAAQANPEEHDYPDIALFERKPPAGFEDTGKYIGFVDFNNVARPMCLKPEPLVNLYHTLVLHFAGLEGTEFEQKARSDLRNRPENHSSSSDWAPTWKYWLLGSRLLPFAEVKVEPEYKIQGVGDKGRKIMRAVLTDEVYLDPKWARIVNDGRWTKAELRIEGYEFEDEAGMRREREAADEHEDADFDQ